jgi:hypothetical protein
MKKCLLSLISLFVFCTIAATQVPAVWTTAKTEILPILNTAKSQIDARWSGAGYCTNFANDLGVVNSARGYELFSQTPPSGPVPAYQNVLLKYVDTSLMAMDTLGFNTVDIALQYPLLVNGFPHQQDYYSFYKRVIDLCRQHGKKIFFEVQASFIDSVYGEPYYSADVRQHYLNPDGNATTNDTLTLNRYRAEKLQMIQLMIDSFRPDYMTLMMEPQTEEYNLSNLTNNSPDSAWATVNYFLANLRKGNTLIGAGAGSWDNMNYFYKFSATGIDFLNFHVYPVQNGYLMPRLFSLDSLSKATGKKLLCGEAWLYKISSAELGSSGGPVATSSAIYARDFYDYWVDADTLFFHTLIDFTQQAGLDAMNFYWPSPFWGQLTYNSTYGAMSYAQQLHTGQQYGFGRMYQFRLSPLGTMMRQRLAGICKTTAAAGPASHKNELTLYPNPATEEIVIGIGNTTVHQVRITDAAGKIFFAASSAAGNSGLLHCDVRTWPAGIYYVIADDARGRIAMRAAVIH